MSASGNLLRLVEMQSSDQVDVIALITAAMDDEEAAWAQQTFEFHFSCQQKGIDSTRQFHAAWLGDVLAGIVGLHRYRWGPAENVWLSWFAVRPDYQGQGIGKWMLGEIKKVARKQGYRKLFIETYRSPTFTRAIEFYQQQGFKQAGSVANFLSDNSDMLVFVQDLD